MTFEDKLQALPATPTLQLGTELGTETPLKKVKLLIYMDNRWRG